MSTTAAEAAGELRIHREAHHWSQAYMAKRLGVPVNTLARWERGELKIRHPEILSLALAFLNRYPEDE